MYPRLRMPIRYKRVRSFIWRVQMIGTGKVANRTSVNMLNAMQVSN